MSHVPSEAPGQGDDPAMVSHNARVGLALFLVYVALYAGFVALNVFTPRIMGDTALPLGGDRVLFLGGNLAIAYGIMLILAAILLSFMYVRSTKTQGKR